MAVEIRRHGSAGGAAAQDSGRREHEAEAAPGKKLVTPGLRRTAAIWAITERGYTQRRARRLIGIDPNLNPWACSVQGHLVSHLSLDTRSRLREREALYGSDAVGLTSLRLGKDVDPLSSVAPDGHENTAELGQILLRGGSFRHRTI